MRAIGILAILLISYSLQAQKVVSGVIYDQDENPVGDVRVVEENSGYYTYSDAQGKFSLFYYSSDNQIKFEHESYDTLVRPLSEMGYPKVFLTKRVRGNIYYLGGRTGYVDFKAKNPNKNLKTMPYLFGEADINRQLQMLPGVEHGSEAFSNLIIRGGNIDDNLMLYNGTPVYNYNHFFGLSSIFHNNGIDNTTIYKGVSPAKYGGRLSSVILVESDKTGKFSGTTGKIEASPFSAGIYIKSIKKDKSYFTLSARRSYFDLLLPQQVRENSLNANFHDIQANFGIKTANAGEWEFNLMNTRDLYLVAFTIASSDTSSNADSSVYSLQYKWSNVIGAVKNKLQINKKWTIENSIHFTQFKNTKLSKETVLNSFITSGIPRSSDDYESGIKEYIFRSHNTYVASNRSSFDFGLQTNIKTYLTGFSHLTSFDYPGLDNIDEFLGTRKFEPTFEFSLYGENRFRKGKDLEITSGLRVMYYINDAYSRPFIEPRFNLNYRLDKQSMLKLAYTRNSQVIKLINVGGTGNPNNVWVPATDIIKPQTSDLAEIGFERRLRRLFSLGVNAYYKQLNNIHAVDNFAEAIRPENDWQSSIFEGNGKSYGLETVFQINEGYFTGWVSYTLSRSTRNFPNLQEGDYLFEFDRTHMFKAYLAFVYTDEWEFGINYLLGSGQLFTIPDGKYLDIDGTLQLEYGSLNNYRSPAYHRFDLSVIKHGSWAGGNSTWKFYIYNLFANRNPLSIYADFENQSFTQVKLERTYLPFVPGLAYVIEF